MLSESFRRVGKKKDTCRQHGEHALIDLLETSMGDLAGGNHLLGHGSSSLRQASPRGKQTKGIRRFEATCSLGMGVAIYKLKCRRGTHHPVLCSNEQRYGGIGDDRGMLETSLLDTLGR